MDKLKILYALYAKATPPQPIRVKMGGWAGDAQKMVNGSDPQPWHCAPYMEATTYGLELTYPFENECAVVNENGAVRIEWDWAREGEEVTGGEFVLFSPLRAPKFYLFNTRVDIVPPQGHVIRSEPHPRYFTDEAGTVPLAMIGHVQNEWWARKLFVVFRAPRPGQRHIFRKGEPYAQLLFVPQRVSYELEAMPPEVEARRRRLEDQVAVSRHFLADNMWQSPDGSEFDNHYKVLAREYARGGMAAVEGAAAQGQAMHEMTLGLDKGILESLALGHAHLAAGRYAEARAVFTHVVHRDPDNADAISHLGICLGCNGQPAPSLRLLARAAELAPANPLYRANLGEMLRMLGQLPEAEEAFRAALGNDPSNPGLLSALGLTMAQQGKFDEGIELCRRVVQMAPGVALLRFRHGLALAQSRRFAEARAELQAAIRADAGFEQARRVLAELPES